MSSKRDLKAKVKISNNPAEGIFSLLNSWKNKRAHPFDPAGIQERIQTSLAKGTPLKFITYWGCGNRFALSEADQAAIERLTAFVSATHIYGINTRLTFIFTDTHAMNNRKPMSSALAYFNDIRIAAEAKDIECIYLSNIWKMNGMSMDVLSSEVQEPDFLESWKQLPLKEKLIEQAGKHLATADDYENAAKTYLRACTLESPVIARQFSDSVFLTYNPPQMDFLLPPLPKIYLFSVKQGTSIKPWFMDATEYRAEAGAA